METSCRLIKRKKIYQWEIQEMSSFIKASNTSDTIITLQSPKFSTRGKIKDFWNLQIQSHDRNSEDKDGISLFLNSFFNREVKTKFSLFIVNNEKKRVNNINLFRTFKAHNSWGLSFIKREDLLKKKDELMPYDILTIGVEITVFDYPVVISTKLPINNSMSPMAHDFEKLYKSKRHSDVEFIVQEKKFQAHKLILMVRSPVFREMLTTDMRENSQRPITIEDMDSEVFEKMLEYLYFDKVSDLDTVAGQLFEAADRFQIHKLKKICAELLCKSVDIDNVSRLLALTYLHDEKEM